MLHHFLSSLPNFLQWSDWIILAIAASMLGLDKSGLRGASIVTVPLFAGYFGGRASASIVLPLLIVGDFCAVAVYRRSARLPYLARLLPAAVVGLVVGALVGGLVPDRVFRLIIACIVLLCLALMAIKEFRGSDFVLPDAAPLHALAGFLGGVSTMMGNAAGPIMATYLLSMDLPKIAFIGTGAVFFWVVNLLKLPAHAFVWKTLNLDSLAVSLSLVPFVLVGFFVGKKIVRVVPDRPFRRVVVAITLVATLRLFFS